jgi:L-ascorbate metabolism protein UlaG (beta-lactamase superfamily)
MNNEKLRTLRPDFPGHRLRAGRYVTAYSSQAGQSLRPLLRWKLTRNPKAAAKRADRFQLELRPVTQLPDPARDYLIWLGHATFLIHVQGRTLLTDPCLTAPPLMRRLCPPPLDLRDLAVDYLLISHGHYDHLDLATLAMLPGPGSTALVPLGLGAQVRAGNPRLAVQEADWYQVYDTGPELRITLLPAQHWHRRGLTDLNRALWGSFHLRWGGRSLYFAGDTGYQDHFREIAALVGPVDAALLPIGAYDPGYMMQQSHMNPEEALRAAGDLRAARMVPMHFGTFDLSDEPLGEPLARLLAAAPAAPGVSVEPLAVGEPWFF